MSYYEILNVGQDAKEEEIKKAYRQKALEYHPDRTSYDIYEAREKFRELDEAYKVLSNDDRRALYDVYHRHKALFEKNQQIGQQMQNQLKKIFLEYENYYQQNSILSDSILEQIPMINLDLLIKIYNTRHQKQNYYNFYKQLSHLIMKDIEESVERECSIPPRQTSAANKLQRNMQTLISTNGQSYRNNSQQQFQQNKKNGYNGLPPKVKLGYDSSDSNTDQLLNNKKQYENDESSNTQNLFNKKQQNQINNNQGYSTNTSSHQNKTQEQIEDELMNEDDDEELVLNQEDMNKYPIDLDEEEEDVQDKGQYQPQKYSNQEEYQNNIENPLESWIRQQECSRQQISPQMQNFYQQYFNLINNYTNTSKSNSNTYAKKGGKNKGAQYENEINENDPLSLYRDRVYSNEFPSNTLQSMSDKDREQQNQLAYQGLQHQHSMHNYHQSKPQQQKLTKKQIKTLWQQTQQKKVIKRISKKQPVFQLIKKADIKRPPIKWSQLQEKIQQVQQQLQQYSQFIMKYKNKKNQPSIMEISKQKYLELVERKKKLFEEQNVFMQKEDELDDYDATLDENELECQQYCLINNSLNNNDYLIKENIQNINQNQATYPQPPQQQVNYNKEVTNQVDPSDQHQQQQQQEYLNEEDLLQRVNDYNNNKYINEEEKYNLSDNNQEFEDQDFGFNQQMHDESDMLNFNDSQGYSSISQENMQEYMNENKEDAERVMKLIMDQQNYEASHKQESTPNLPQQVVLNSNSDKVNQQQNLVLNKNQSSKEKYVNYDYPNDYQQQTEFIPNQINLNNNIISMENQRPQEYNYGLDYNKCNQNMMQEDFNFNDNPNFMFQDQIQYNQDNFMETPVKKNFFMQETPSANIQQFNNINDDFSYSNQAKNKTSTNNFQQQENYVSEIDHPNFKNDESSYQYLHQEDDYNNHFNNQQEFNFEQNI